MPALILACFSVGIILISLASVLIPVWIMPLLLFGLCLLWGLICLLKRCCAKYSGVAGCVVFRSGFQLWLLLLFSLLLGMSWSNIWGHWRMAQQLPELCNNQKVWLSGLVTKVEFRPYKPLKIDLSMDRSAVGCSIDDARPFATYVPSLADRKLRLNWYESRFIPEPGDRLKVRAKLKSLHGRLNPGSFDYQTWLFTRGVDAVGYVMADAENRRIGTEPLSLFARIRQMIDALHAQHIGNPEIRAVTRALLTGEKSGFSQAQWDAFRHTGTTHLVVISGLHIGLLSWFVFHLAGFVVRRTGWGMPRYRADFWAALAAVAVAFFYAGLAGFTIPALRAMLMVWAFLLGLIFAIPLRYRTRFLLALALVLLLDPLAIYQPGFWLSFGIVALILVYSKAKIYRSSLGLFSKFRFFIQLQWLIFLGMTPLLAWFFKEISLIAPLVNILAIPYVSFILVPINFIVSLLVLLIPDGAGLPVVQQMLFTFLSDLTAVLMAILHDLSAINFASMSLPHADMAWVLLACIAGCGLFLPWRYFRFLGLLAVVVLCWPRASGLSSGEFRLAVLDMGQGLSVLVQTQKHQLLYDAGPGFSYKYVVPAAMQHHTNRQGSVADPFFSDLVATDIMPTLHHYGAHVLDKLIISHHNRDHAGGLASILLQIPVRQLYAPAELLVKFLSVTPEKKLCLAGMQWSWDQVHFKVIHPHPADIDAPYQENNRSCVLHISSAYGSALLTGDIEQSVEQKLVKDLPAGPVEKHPVQADLLLVPHHGSKSSSSVALLGAVAPDYAVVSAGYQNRFRHPHPQVTERYQQHDVALYRTDRDGLVDFTFTREGIKLATQRQTEARYWR